MVVGICSSIGIWEPHAKFQQNRMGGFRDRCFEGVFYEVSFLSWGAGSGSLPTRPEEVGKSPDHLENVGAPCCDNGHTSSKGMPRHAHGRWALMRVCGVDVTDVSLSCWWCVRWLVRTECLE